jgi:hypothetical protein
MFQGHHEQAFASERLGGDIEDVAPSDPAGSEIGG